MRHLKDIFGFKSGPSKLLSKEEIDDISDVTRDYFEDLGFTRIYYDELIGFYDNPNDDVFLIFKWMQTTTINYIEVEVITSKQIDNFMRLRRVHHNLAIVDRLKSMGFKVEVSNMNNIKRATRFTIKVYK